MSRKKLSEVVEGPQELPGDVSGELKELVDNYIADKGKAKEIDERVSETNKRIKELFNEQGLDHYEGDTGTVKLSTQTRESFREDDLIAFLKAKGIEGDVIKTKEYVDFDVLESMIYHGNIDAPTVAEMDSCKDKTVVTILRISKKKGDR